MCSGRRKEGGKRKKKKTKEKAFERVVVVGGVDSWTLPVLDDDKLVVGIGPTLGTPGGGGILRGDVEDAVLRGLVPEVGALGSIV